MSENLNEVEKLEIRPFTRFCMSIGAVPSSYLAGLSIEEQLLWLCSYLEKEVIPTVNNNGEAVEELQELYEELHDYVENYFDNLDVQDEINNKLDAMVEAGTLQEIIASYLNSKAVFGFDSVSSMKESTNLINGSYARTFGYYSSNDGGAALYKIRNITNDDVVDEMFIIEISDQTNQLVAELVPINNQVSLKQLGLKGDNSTDETIKLQKAFASSYDIIVDNGTYITNDDIIISSSKKVIGEKGSVIKAKQGMLVGTHILRIESDNVEIQGLTIDGNIVENPIGATYGANQGITLLQIYDSSTVLIKESTFQNNAYLGIQIIGTNSNEDIIENLIFDKNNFYNIDCGIISLGGNYILQNSKFINNTFNGHSKSEGISLFHTGLSKSILIDNNIILNKTQGNAIYLNNGTGENIIVTNNVVNNCASGVNITNATELNIHNNNIVGTIESNILSIGIRLNNCQKAIINNNYLEHLLNTGFELISSSLISLTDNMCLDLNTSSSSTYLSACLLRDCNNIKAHNNYCKRHLTTNTHLYSLLGTLTYIYIDEQTNNSDVAIGYGVNGITSLTNSTILTNLSINGNFTKANISSNTNLITQVGNIQNNDNTLALSYRWKFGKTATFTVTSAKTLSVFEINNLIEGDIYTLNIVPSATITLSNNVSDDYGITWKSERTFNTPTQLKLMYHNLKMYEV